VRLPHGRLIVGFCCVCTPGWHLPRPLIRTMPCFLVSISRNGCIAFQRYFTQQTTRPLPYSFAPDSPCRRHITRPHCSRTRSWPPPQRQQTRLCGATAVGSRGLLGWHHQSSIGRWQPIRNPGRSWVWRRRWIRSQRWQPIRHRQPAGRLANLGNPVPLMPVGASRGHPSTPRPGWRGHMTIAVCGNTRISPSVRPCSRVCVVRHRAWPQSMPAAPWPMNAAVL
jgi:hypothetical protein